MTVDWSDMLNTGPGEDGYPEAFKFQNKGDSITGDINEIREFTKDDKKTRVLEIDTGKEVRSVFVGGSPWKLQELVAAASPQVGDRITITFLGMTPPGKNGRPSKDFEVTKEPF